ncbi:tRNA (adenosine(37)-N6)-threonylcarbamoyltransferase complex dimerization subunit type 1 TsaB [Pseudaquidulcibacter saccharophilus]|uniref:tRNA (adenosine(37)-N6)-threonylcarbamoyltransferase complex dimerization subunit type 1 TsaB n=1 Tax=Pseudaquidulcibacter saccharophilus TaxID=2831900 RepID=UPI001EFF0ABA|nr:tRNA (adenosine(37)-N6)-threonylcarbamoyltransferase complex dimerization subunit type 1 TsaB [Pseudaquidulcibacter saccharophilus]
MAIIGIDTALKHCSIAILGDGINYEQCVPAPSNQAEILPQMLSDALLKTGIKNSDIEKIAVTIGPGSFTGVRVGLAFAKGLAISLGSELLGINSFEAFVKQANAPKTICAINVAGSVFMAAKDGDNWILPPTRFEDFTTINDYKGFTLVGHAIPKELGASLDDFIHPLRLCEIAKNENQQTRPPVPQYMRGADAVLWQGGKFAGH